MHIQHLMMMHNFNRWDAFKAEQTFGEQWGFFSTQSGCSAIDVGTTIMRLSYNGSNHNYSSHSRDKFDLENCQKDLFYFLIYRDGFYRVDSKASHTTHQFKTDDNDGGRVMQYSTPKSNETIFRRRANFPMGHIQTKLNCIQLGSIQGFTLEKVENKTVGGLYYKFLVNNEHLMSVDRHQTDAFYQLIDKEFYVASEDDKTKRYQRK